MLETVEGAAPAPPPTTRELAASAALEAQVLLAEKYTIPPLVPATVNAGVVVGVATETIPPVNPTVVTVPAEELEAFTKSVLFHAATHFSLGAIVIPVVGKDVDGLTALKTIDCVLLELTTM
jgi:hypothetical protein